MKKYIYIYLLLLKMNLHVLITYRANLFNSSISSVGWGIVSLLSMFILTAKNSSIYGWNRNELLLLSGIYSISVGVFHTIFSKNFDNFSQTIHKGQLDSILLKPIDSQFLLSFTLFQFLGSSRVLLGILFTWFMLSQMHIVVSIVQLISFSLLVLIGILLMYSIWFVVITVTIWASNLDNLKDFLYQLNNAGRYPPEIIMRAGNLLLFLLIPLTFVASVPVKVLLLKTSSIDILLFISISLIFLLISRKFWRYALRFYTSANI